MPVMPLRTHSVQLAITVGVVLVAGLVGVGGDFPLSDDWSYAHTAKTMCEQGQIDILPWTGASSIFQSAYGALLCKLTGFSFVTLRLSTLTMSLLAILGSMQLLRAVGVTGSLMALAIVTLALNPLMVNLSFTYMTDVPFTALSVWAAYWYLRGLRRDRLVYTLAGAALASAAVLIRQHALMLSVAATVAYLLHTDRHLRGRVVAGFAAVGPPAAVLLTFHLWLMHSGQMPQGLVEKLSEATTWQPSTIAANAFKGAMYIGLFLIPIALPMARDATHRVHRAAAVIFCFLSAVAGYAYMREGTLMPYLTNLIYDLGLGAMTLRDQLFLGMDPPVIMGPGLWALVTGVALIGTALSAATVVTARVREPGWVFLTLAAVLMFAGTLAHTGFYFDRYLLPVLPLAIPAVCGVRPQARPQAIAWLLAILLAGYAVTGTHDYMSWNRARYGALERLLNAEVPPTVMDGGMDFNGWDLAKKLDRWPTKEAARTGQAATRKSWWWVVDDRYVASFTPIAGYDIHERAPFRRWLPPGAGEVLILERTGGD